MGMYVLADSCNREISLNWFDSLEEAKSALVDEYESVNRIEDGEISEDGMSAWCTARYSDNDWLIEEIPVADHLRGGLEKFKSTTGWRRLGAENAIKAFIRFIEEEA